jgi:tRNA threonylcarbamoyladenosine biosynthesis protein TsaE
MPSSREALDRPLGVVVYEDACADLSTLRGVAGRLAAAMRPGDLVLLFGPLGAGKTTLVRMVCEALEVTDQVRSPSFTIANIYAGPVPVFHLDLYRLEEFDEEDVLSLEEYVSVEAVTMVEWPEAGRSRLGDPAWVIRLGHRDLDTRTLMVEAGDTDAQVRWEAAA